MVFASTAFLTLFLPLCLALCALTRNKIRLQNGLLLLLSLFFYAWGELSALPVLLFSALVNALLPIGISRTKNIRLSRLLFFLSLCINLSLLIFYKYLSFGIRTYNALSGMSVEAPSIALPLGISFFTFQGISYATDVLKSRVKPGSIGEGVLYICFFPQLIAGPILRFNDFAPQLRKRKMTWYGAEKGLCRFSIGLAKKVLLADVLSQISDAVFACPDDERFFLLMLLGAIAFTMQIYLDFSGYADMAIGLGQMLGFQLPENFNHPLRALSMRDFWHRWHMTLSIWFRDYVYIPLGGSRKGAGRTAVNLLVVFLLTGLWHGAGWTFFLWGGWNGVLLLLEHTHVLRTDSFPKPFAHLYTVIAVLLGFILFRAENLPSALNCFSSLTRLIPTGAMLARLVVQFTPIHILALLLSGVVSFADTKKWQGYIRKHPGLKDALCLLLLMLSYLSLTASGFHPFLYFRF